MKKLILILLVILLITPQADAWKEERWVDEEGCLHIIRTPTAEGEKELADETNRLSLLRASLATRKEEAANLTRWLTEARNNHDLKMKEIEEQISLNYLKATLNLLKYNNECRSGENINVNVNR